MGKGSEYNQASSFDWCGGENRGWCHYKDIEGYLNNGISNFVNALCHVCVGCSQVARKRNNGLLAKKDRDALELY